MDLAWPPLDGYTPTTDTVLYFDNTFGDLQGQTTQANFGFQLTPVPVPAAAWLFGSGLLGLAGLARRNRRS